PRPGDRGGCVHESSVVIDFLLVAVEAAPCQQVDNHRPLVGYPIATERRDLPSLRIDFDVGKIYVADFEALAPAEMDPHQVAEKNQAIMACIGSAHESKLKCLQHIAEREVDTYRRKGVARSGFAVGARKVDVADRRELPPLLTVRCLAL